METVVFEPHLIIELVRRRGNKLQEILNSAGKACELRGYEAPEGEEVPMYTRRQVRALYNAVKEKGMQFQNSAKVNLNDQAQYMQLVRFPEDSLSQQSANCLDMAVLFASLLSSCQISPLVLFVPGHALVGWKDGKGGCEFIQTTGISTMSFEEARTIGMQYFSPRKTVCEDWLKRWAESIEDPKQLVIEDAKEFSILIDVDEVARKLRLTPV